MQHKDPLTGVPSRAAQLERLPEEVERARRYGHPLSLLLLDLDHFKSINDAFGHARGDVTLIEVTQRMAETIRQTDLLFRYGGDEFVILLPHSDKEQAVVIAERLLEQIQARPFGSEPPLSLSLSIGVSSFPDDGTSDDALLECADRRHYHAKRTGRGRVVSEDPDDPTALPLAPPSRLLERESAIEASHQFLSMLHDQRHGVLRIVGGPSSGKTRLLAEIRHLAHLHGYAVLESRGTPALKARVYGALAEARVHPEAEALPSPVLGVQAWERAVTERLRGKGQKGLVILIEEATQVDEATLDFLHTLLFNSQLERVALVYTTPHEDAHLALFREAALHQSVSLLPLTHEGVRLWLRHALRWEAPGDVVDWLYDETGGWPGNIHQALCYLLDERHIHLTADGKVAHVSLAGVPLRALLARHTGTPPHNLPHSLTDLMGREAALRRLKAMIRRQRLVTIVGPGGVGKTRLALQVAAESLEAFPGGVFYVQLAAIQDAALLPLAIADAVGLALSGAQAPTPQLVGWLRHRSALILLDSVEHLHAIGPLLQSILEEAPSVRLLLTSRERLHLPQEVVFELPGLSFPNEASTLPMERSSAVQLFVRRARLAEPSFSLSEAETPFVVRICQLVEGMPLGIELAAAWTRAYPCSLIAASIEANAAFLTTQPSPVPNRERALLAVLDAFWGLLSEAECQSARQLSVFCGGFSEQAASKVAGASPFFLDALVGKSYLRATEPGRFALHELLQQDGAKRLKAAPEEEAVVYERHSLFYMDFLAEREKRFLEGGRAALSELTMELENVRAAWQWALSRGNEKALARGAGGLANWYAIQGLFQEGADVFKQAAALMQSQPGANAADPVLVARLLLEQARFYNYLGHHQQAIDLADETMSHARVGGDEALWAAVAMQQGMALARLGKTDLACERLQMALERARAVQAEEVETDVLRCLGIVARARGEPGAAQAFLEQALARFHAAGNRLGESATLNSRGLLSMEQGRYEEARSFFEQSLRLCREMGDRWSESNVLNSLGNIGEIQGDFQQASEWYDQALARFQALRDQRGESNALHSLGNVARAQGELERARRYYERAIEIKQAIEEHQGEAQVRASLARLGPPMKEQ